MPFPIMAAMAAVSIGTTLYGAYAASKAQKSAGGSAMAQGAYNREMAEYNAEKIREKSRLRAEKIFAAGDRLRSQQVAQQAGSGAVIGEGSAAAVVEETRNLAQEDALVALYAGIEGAQAETYEGDMQFRAGENKFEASKDAAKATLISGIGRAANQYHTYSSMKV